jgi:hypothetical protein
MGGGGGGVGALPVRNVSLPAQFSMEVGRMQVPLPLHGTVHSWKQGLPGLPPMQLVHTACWFVAQKVPKVGSVKPPLDEHPQLSLPFILAGCVAQMVAASFQALQVCESPALKGYTPPLSVGAVLS